MKIIKDENYNLLLDKSRVFVIPTAEKPIKMLFPDRYDIKETENGLEVTEKMSLLEAINKVKAAGNDPVDFIDVLIEKGKWEGMIV